MHGLHSWDLYTDSIVYSYTFSSLCSVLTQLKAPLELNECKRGGTWQSVSKVRLIVATTMDPRHELFFLYYYLILVLTVWATSVFTCKYRCNLTQTKSCCGDCYGVSFKSINLVGDIYRFRSLSLSPVM